MKRIAIVVQRCHQSIVGGSESLAWQYANLLKHDYQTEVLTTRAFSTSDWANALPAGVEVIDDVLIRRFSVTTGRTSYWPRLHERLLRDAAARPAPNERHSTERVFLPWTMALQEEFIRTQGPYSNQLFEFLEEHWLDYCTIIFVTYLYPTSYFGILHVPRNFALFAPTLHDEEPARLSVYKHAARRARRMIWLTDAERRLGHALWGKLEGDTIGMNIDTMPRPSAIVKGPYLLYSGRIDPNKGCPELFDYFIRFKNEYPSDLRLILAGQEDIAVPKHPDIDFRGFVSAEEKFRLMAGAAVFVMPSRKESFSIVALEALGQGTPVLASRESHVLRDHLKQSAGGYLYSNYEEFAAKLYRLVSDKEHAKIMGARGRDYVVSNYASERVRRDLIRVVESCCEEKAKSASF